MNKNDTGSGKTPGEDRHQYKTSDKVGREAGGTSEPDIQPSEPKNIKTETQNKTGDPGRTPGKAEGSRETVEEDLKKQQQ